MQTRFDAASTFLLSVRSSVVRLAGPLAAAAAVLSFATSAHAQAPASRGAGYAETRAGSDSAVIFDDEAATGSTLGALGATIRPPSGAFRMALVRPRLNFVSEMLKSVEGI